jgi:double-stranded uracil-DNA glycosylase
MDHPTITVYEERAGEYEATRRAVGEAATAAFAVAARSAAGGRPLVDLGCGPGWSLPHLGEGPTIALDAAGAMLDRVPSHAPTAWRVRADLTALPFRRGVLGGAWASKSYVHVARSEAPLAFAELHRAMVVGGIAELILFQGDQELGRLDDDDFPGRAFSLWPVDHLTDVLVGAGFDLDPLVHTEGRGGGAHLRARLTRARTLADTVGPDMRLLIVGLNPSLFAADAGVGFARPGNRFWPAAMSAGVVSRDRDPMHALGEHGVGMTDLVKRATARADQLSTDEYRDGLARLTRLVGWLHPEVVCLVGLAGWRAAAGRTAQPGWQPELLADRPVYLMPSTSGLNARTPLPELSAHLAAAAAGPS